MQESIFTRIIKGEIPCHKIYEDERTFAFLDIHPIQPGQVLVVAKNRVPYIWDLDDDDYRAVMETVRKVGRRLREVFPDKARIGVQVEGLDVDHVHVKVFPFDDDVQFRHHPDMSAEPDHEALASIAKSIAF